MAKDKRRINQNRAKKKARIAARKKHKHQQKDGFDLFAYMDCTRAEFQRLPIHAAYVGDAIFAQGMGYAIIARDLPDGRIATSQFLIDAYSLGVKNAFFTVLTPSQFNEMIETSSRTSPLSEVTAPYVRKLVEDSIAYALDLGFSPHHDYHKAAIILGDIDSAECSETFTFGHQGKPLYISGPKDSGSFVQRVIGQLKRRCGPDGSHFIAKADAFDIDESDDEEDDDDDYDPLPLTVHDGGKMEDGGS